METELNLCIGSSKWTSENRNRAVHIYLAGRVICGKSYQNGWADVFTGTEKQSACDKCKRMYNKQHPLNT